MTAPERPGGPPAPSTAGRRRRSRSHGVPEVAVALAVAAGLVLVSLGYWRTGLASLGGGLVGAAVFRLVLPPAEVPLLVNRSRWVDATVLVALGGAILGLAWQLVYAPPFR